MENPLSAVDDAMFRFVPPKGAQQIRFLSIDLGPDAGGKSTRETTSDTKSKFLAAVAGS